jgi:hypothetical protein
VLIIHLHITILEAKKHVGTLQNRNYETYK